MATSNMQKYFCEDRKRSSEHMIVERQTDRHAHHNTPLPYRRGRSNKLVMNTGCTEPQS